MTEKRIRTSDRRLELASSGPTITVYDCKGGCKRCDRRSRPDRRLNNISVDDGDSIDYLELVVDRVKE